MENYWTRFDESPDVYGGQEWRDFAPIHSRGISAQRQFSILWAQNSFSCFKPHYRMADSSTKEPKPIEGEEGETFLIPRGEDPGLTEIEAELADEQLFASPQHPFHLPTGNSQCDHCMGCYLLGKKRLWWLTPASLHLGVSSPRSL